MENKIEKIKALGKDAIIKMAEDFIKEKYPTVKINLGNFDIKVFADDKEILVEFFRMITFFPKGIEWRLYRSKLHVYLINKRFDTSYTRDKNVEHFFLMLQENKEYIEFVKKALNISDPVFKAYGNGHLTICEEEDRYRVRVGCLAGYRTDYIDKITGDRSGGVTASGNTRHWFNEFGLKIMQLKNLLRD